MTIHHLSECTSFIQCPSRLHLEYMFVFRYLQFWWILDKVIVLSTGQKTTELWQLYLHVLLAITATLTVGSSLIRKTRFSSSHFMECFNAEVSCFSLKISSMGLSVIQKVHSHAKTHLIRLRYCTRMSISIFSSWNSLGSHLSVTNTKSYKCLTDWGALFASNLSIYIQN